MRTAKQWGFLTGLALLLMASPAFFVSVARGQEPAKPPVVQPVSPIATIPFVLTGDQHIQFKARLSGREVECHFDTGAQLTIWPSSLNLKGKDNKKSIRYGDAFGNTVPVSLFTLETVQIGNFIARDVPSYRAEVDKIPKDAPGSLHKTPLLGNDVFANHTIVIDYGKRHIEVYDPAIPLEQLAKTPSFGILDVVGTGGVGDGYGQPHIEAEIAGQRVKLIVDTGWAAHAVLLEPEFESRLKGIYESATVKARGTFGRKEVTGYGWVPLKLSRTPVYQYLVPTFINETFTNSTVKGLDGVLGIGILMPFRIALNYKAGKLLLEPQQTPEGLEVGPPFAALPGMYWTLQPLEDGDSDYVLIPLARSAATDIKQSSIPPPPPFKAKDGFHWRWYPSINEWALIPDSSLKPDSTKPASPRK